MSSEPSMCLAASLAHPSPDLCRHPSPSLPLVPSGRVEVGSTRGRPVSSAEPGMSCVGRAGQRGSFEASSLPQGGQVVPVQAGRSRQAVVPRLPLRAWRKQ